MADGSQPGTVSGDGKEGHFAEGKGVRLSPLLACELTGGPKEAEDLTLGNDISLGFMDEPP